MTPLIDKEQAASRGRTSTLEIVGLSQRFLKHAPCRGAAVSCRVCIDRLPAAVDLNSSSPRRMRPCRNPTGGNDVANSGHGRGCDGSAAPWPPEPRLGEPRNSRRRQAPAGRPAPPGNRPTLMSKLHFGRSGDVPFVQRSAPRPADSAVQPGNFGIAGGRPNSSCFNCFRRDTSPRHIPLTLLSGRHVTSQAPVAVPLILAPHAPPALQIAAKPLENSGHGSGVGAEFLLPGNWAGWGISAAKADARCGQPADGAVARRL
ncbi:hypothetical protein Pan44_44350 [Caulifigura coniformis]|uniref:Uncharacterized protein n=1 Tax=Caulifigura coniformis TaxID=2527983 RepID=A0A517SJT0_9PLAN|nr:hypothetical protein Pan44_44350 [Caulifigura coniformis]